MYKMKDPVHQSPSVQPRIDFWSFGYCADGIQFAPNLLLNQYKLADDILQFPHKTLPQATYIWPSEHFQGVLAFLSQSYVVVRQNSLISGYSTIVILGIQIINQRTLSLK